MMKKTLLLLLVVVCIPHSGKTENSLYTIASFSTAVDHQVEGVKHNILLTCQKLDGFVVGPQKEFSFNAVVGEGNARNGFVAGRVLYHDRIVMEPGGGICQVSSTLFNAFMLAGCRIVERHRHYQPVTYVPLGLDATIKYGKKNLRIKNPYQYPLHIFASMNDKSMLVVIKAKRKLAYRYELDTDEETVTIPFARDQEKIRQGISVYVYRKKYKDTKLIESFLLYKDYYPPVYVK